MSLLLDTNVLSDIREKTPTPGVIAWFESVPAKDLFANVMVIGEIRQGIDWLAGTRRGRSSSSGGSGN